MLKIRMSRTGKRNQAMFLMVVTEHSKAAHRGFIEVLGSVNPHTNPSTVQINTERVKHWMSVGAHVSSRAAHHLAQAGVEVPKERIDQKPRSGKLPEPVGQPVPTSDATNKTPSTNDDDSKEDDNAKNNAPQDTQKEQKEKEEKK